MEAVLGLIVMLLGLSHGVGTYCDGRQDGAQCYGALGGTVDIQLMDSSSEIPRYKLLKNFLMILSVRNSTIIPNTIVQGSLFSPGNGTFRINNLSRNDSGDYTLETFDSDGYSSGERTLKLIVQAPVSSVLLVSECLSQGEMRVSYKSLLICGLRAVVVILLLIGISIYFAWKKKKHDKAEVSAVPQTRGDPEDSLLMVEMSSATYTNA
ncbi:uncharacterized protein LOC118453433 [Neolamprologus brichardi]|uniref:uncharacterized protein LOC118453433 n=1 Tax=Neolamprologus brichardi TaxID=32507 RepID=UPI001643C005|nr:uncharacterized protein LOC118453433 [Neolamprologus brichardi]